jgi:hypothetical protein
MTLIYSFVVIITFTVAFAYRNANQFLERRAASNGAAELAFKYSTKWHVWQAIIQVLVFCTIAIANYNAGYSLMFVGILGALGGAIFWLLFDGIVNIVGLKRHFFYVGQTAFMDRMLHKSKRPELLAALLKSFFILAFIILLFIVEKRKK